MAQLSLTMTRIYPICVVLITLWKVQSEPSLPVCIAIRTLGNVSADNLTIIVQTGLMNVTFYINTDACGDVTQSWLFKISEYHRGTFVDICKVFLTKSKCQETESSTNTCFCLNDGQHFVQFLNNGSDSKVYEWQLKQESTTVLTGRIHFVIQKSRKFNDSTQAGSETEQGGCVGFCTPWRAILVSTLCAAIVTAFIIAFVVIRHRRTRGQSSNTTVHCLEVFYGNLHEIPVNDGYDHISIL